VRVVGVDAVEEIGYGDMRQALSRLASEGYVELDHNADSSAGTVTLTGKGLEKIRYLRAFRSNLPRPRRGGRSPCAVTGRSNT
jgi:hypothetical protein